MLTLLIVFCLIYVLVRVCLGCWGYILKQSFLWSPVSLSWFPQSPTPVSTPNTCIVTGVFLGGCQVSHLPLSFFPLSFLCFLFFLFFADALIFNTLGHPMLGERTCANLSCVILCHLASLCRLALMLLLFLWWYVMVLILNIRVCHLCFLQQHWGFKTPQQPKDAGFVGEMDWGEKCAPHLW